MQAILQKDVGGTLTWELPERPDAGPTVDVYDPDGSRVVTAGVATRDTVATTLNGAVAVGDVTMTLTSSTGVIEGRKYRIAASTAGPAEWVTVRSIASLVVTLAAPLNRAHATGTAFESTYVTYAVAAAVCNVASRHWRAVLHYLVGAVARPDTERLEFAVSNYPIRPILTWADMHEYDPLVYSRVPSEYEFERILARTWSMLWRRLAAKTDGVPPVDSNEFVDAHAFLTLAHIFGGVNASSEGRDQAAWYLERAEEELSALAATVAVDKDEDGAIEIGEITTSGILERA